jgi:hypothetical protein
MKFRSTQIIEKVKGGIKFIQLVPILFIFLDACVDPLEVSIPNISPKLVVDGLITDQPGPYQVRLLYSISIDSTVRRPRFETGATVFITDSDGHQEPLLEAGPGVYQTSAASSFRGVVGKSYQLNITTKKGKKINSTPQQMVGAGTIDNLYLEFVKDVIPIGDPTRTDKYDAFNVFVNATGVENSPNLFRWRVTGTYKAKTFPELRFIVANDFNATHIPKPEPCSGYIAVGLGIVKVAECTCCICWGTEYSTNAMVSDNRFLNDRSFERVQVGVIPVTSLRFYEKYYVEVEQLSLPSQIYDFWRLTEIQQKSGSNIFQPNAVKIKGNMISATDPNEEILGVFSVSAVVKRTMFIYPTDVPASLPVLDTVRYDCRNSFVNATTQQPLFW